MTIREGLAFDDVLLEPAYSCIQSRSLIDLHCGFTGDRASLTFEQPIIPANMKDIASTALVNAQLDTGGLALLHRFQSIEEQVEQFRDIDCSAKLGASVGVKREDFDRAKALVLAGCRIFCVDIAHGDSYLAVQMASYLRHDVGARCFVIAGNVATATGARRLWEAGADAVKVGVGPGSLCTTRIETGNGVPQLTALMDVAKVRDEYFPKKGIIADGGVRSAGDCVKALCFSDMVMLGRCFAGTDEAAGFAGSEYKTYSGSSTHKANHVEGVRARVPKAGPYAKVVKRLLEGIRSGCSYQGSDTLRQLRAHPQFIRITNSGLRESYPHDVELVPGES